MEQDEQQQRTEPLQTMDHQPRTQPMDIDTTDETMMTCPTSRTKTISGGCTNTATGDKCLKFGHQTHSIPGCNNTQEQHCDRPGNSGTDTRKNTQETTWTRNSASPDQTDERETNKNAGNTTQTEESTNRVPLFLEDEIDQHKETEEQSTSNPSNIDRNREPDPDTTESSTTDEEEQGQQQIQQLTAIRDNSPSRTMSDEIHHRSNKDHNANSNIHELVVSAIHFILASKRTTKTCPLQEACLIRLPNCVKFTDTWRNVNELLVVTPWKSTAITIDWDPNENTE